MSEPKPKPLKSAKQYKAMAEKLAGCVVFAISHLDVRGSRGGLMFNVHAGEAAPWQDKFFDALEFCGFKYDRESYYASLAKPKRRKASR